MDTEEALKFKLGDRVRVLHTRYVTGHVIEHRGPLGPRRMQIYRLELHQEPEPAYVEVREDQLEALRDDEPG